MLIVVHRLTMDKLKNSSVLSYVNPIVYKISSLLLIFTRYNSTTHQLDASWKGKFASALFCVGWITLFLYSMHLRALGVYKGRRYVDIFVDVSDAVCVCFANVSVTANMGLLNVNHFNEARKKMIEVDCILKKYVKPRRTTVWFFADLLLVAGLGIVMIVIMTFYCYKQGTIVCLSSAVDRVGKIRTIYITFLIALSIKEVRCRLLILNEILKDCSDFRDIGMGVLREFKFRNNWIAVDVQNIGKTFTLLIETTRNYNKVFGWTILAYSLSSVSSVLVLINFSFHVGNIYCISTADFAVVAFFYTGTTLLYEMYLIRCCEGLVKTSENIAATALKISESLDVIKFPHYTRPKEDLLLLAEQAKSQTPKVTAAGFFNMEFRIFFVLMEIATTEVLMLIQFRH